MKGKHNGRLKMETHAHKEDTVQDAINKTQKSLKKANFSYVILLK